MASTPGRVRRVWLLPGGAAGLPGGGRPRSAPPTWSSSGPGSWFTSVLPHLLVPELRDALIDSRARRVVVLNLAPQPGETAGFSPEQHLDVLSEHAPRLRVDAVLADVAAVPVPDRLRRAAAAVLSPGGRVQLAPVAAGDGGGAPRSAGARRRAGRSCWPARTVRRACWPGPVASDAARGRT